MTKTGETERKQRKDWTTKTEHTEKEENKLTKTGQTERKQRKDWTTKTEQRTRKTS